jgi:hypothetical protein
MQYSERIKKKVDLFPSSDKIVGSTYSARSIRKSSVLRWKGQMTNRPSCANVVFLLNDRRWAKSGNSVTPCSIFYYYFEDSFQYNRSSKSSHWGFCWCDDKQRHDYLYINNTCQDVVPAVFQMLWILQTLNVNELWPRNSVLWPICDAVPNSEIKYSLI